MSPARYGHVLEVLGGLCSPCARLRKCSNEACQLTLDFHKQLSVCQLCDSGKYVRWYCERCATDEAPRCDACS